MVNLQHLGLVSVWVCVIFLNSIWVSLDFVLHVSHLVISGVCLQPPASSLQPPGKLLLSVTIINIYGGLCFLFNFIEVIVIAVVINYLKLYLGSFGLGPSVLQSLAGEKPVFFLNFF
jgi:hypothetical protein